jgi:hypothetical protein
MGSASELVIVNSEAPLIERSLITTGAAPTLIMLIEPVTVSPAAIAPASQLPGSSSSAGATSPPYRSTPTSGLELSLLVTHAVSKSPSASRA